MEASFRAQLDNLLWALATVAFIAIGSLALAHTARLIARWRGASGSVQRRTFWGFLFAAPWIIGFVIFVLGPALASLYYSFTNYKLGEQPRWEGLENYREFVTGEGAYGRRFKQAMFNSFYYAVVGVPLQIVASLAMAVLLNQKIRGIRVFRLIFYTPVILAGGPAILLAWRYMLAANGGFVNETLQGLARSFFIFDWLYRGFIYGVESFNGLYAGLARGDPIGPFKYTMAAILAVLVLLTLIGDWTPAKRDRALRAAEIIGVILGLILIGNGIVAEAVDPAWILVFGAAVCIFLWRYQRHGSTKAVRLLLIATLVAAALTFVVLVTQQDPELGSAFYTPYLLALAAAVTPLVLLFVVPERLRSRLLGAAVLVFAALLIVRVVPQQFGGDRWQLPLRYLSLNTALAQPGNIDYLNDVCPAETMTVLLFYGALVGVLVAAVALGSRYARARRTLLLGTLVFFILFGLGSALDGARFFRAYDDVAVASGNPSFHFTLFRNAASTFPDNSRVPLWMTNELWTKPALVLITMWSSGASMLIFLAALKGVPESLYEAAEVDGASRIQKFFKITLPMISPALFYNIVIGIIAALQTFETVFILQTAQSVDSVRSTAFFLFERTFREQAIGQGASISWILAVIIVVLTIMQFRYSRWVHYEV